MRRRNKNRILCQSLSFVEKNVIISLYLCYFRRNNNDDNIDNNDDDDDDDDDDCIFYIPFRKFNWLKVYKYL